MSFWSSLAKIGGIAGPIIAAPFTGGASLSLIPTLLTAGAAAAGGFLSNTKGARTGQQTNTTTPIESPAYASLGDLLRARAEERLRGRSFDFSGYKAGGIQDINDVFRNAQTGLNADLTSRGLGTSPIAGTATAHLAGERAGNIAQFLSGIPELRRKYENEDFAAAGGVYATRPMGTQQSGTYTLPGSALAGGAASLAQMLAYLQTMKALQGGGSDE